MATGDLITLATAKAWLNITTNNDDAVLARWITGASRYVLNMLDRGPTLGYHVVNEVRNGTDGLALMLREWPVLSVSALTTNSVIQMLQTNHPFGTGYFFEAWNGSDVQGRQQLYCAGIRFSSGSQNVSVTYAAGYQIKNEISIIPPTPFQVQTARAWYSDQGVTFANGTALIPAVFGTTPTTGYYTTDPSTGLYLFAVADVGQTILITYSYTPEDLQQGVLDVVSWNMKARDRIGMVSKSLGGQETMSFSQKGMSDLSTMLIQPYRSISPV